LYLKYNEIAALLDLAPAREDFNLLSAVTDSREVTPGALFVCIPGSRVDGHDFVSSAEQSGASAVLSSRALPDARVPVLHVADTVLALGRIAAFWRGKTRAKVVGITGTAGKTTVKELLARILAVGGKTAYSALNYNNRIGMPRAVLNTHGDEAFWVMEAGISRAGDMEELARILRPNMGIILNAGAGHVEGLGEKGIAWHKTRLLSYLASDGGIANGAPNCGLVSADYPDLEREAKHSGSPLHFFSAAGRSVKYRGIYEGRVQGTGRGKYRLLLNGETCTVVAPFYGEYGAENVIAAAAAAHLLGLSADEIVEGVARAATPAGRFNVTRLGVWEVIDDTYNANPLSMRRMLDAGFESADGKAFVPVLGEMLELGAQAAEEHEKLGRCLATLRPAAVIWKGGHAEAVRAGLRKGGYAGPCLTVTGSDDFFVVWSDLLRLQALSDSRGGVVLFKGSRANRLEELFTAFCRLVEDKIRQKTHNTAVGDCAHVL
jgi:UDP-N-acetylmuramoyl-tripeptide--D-alanyl-D-alanine ligase